jgi:hypothetical protein
MLNYVIQFLVKMPRSSLLLPDELQQQATVTYKKERWGVADYRRI